VATGIKLRVHRETTLLSVAHRLNYWRESSSAPHAPAVDRTGMEGIPATMYCSPFSLAIQELGLKLAARAQWKSW
jgi:hypothetical protein